MTTIASWGCSMGCKTQWRRIANRLRDGHKQGSTRSRSIVSCIAFQMRHQKQYGIDSHLIQSRHLNASNQYGEIHPTLNRRIGCRRGVMSLAIQNRLEQMHQRHDEILDAMKRPGLNPNFSSELSRLSGAVKLYKEYQRIKEEQQSVMDLLHDAIHAGDVDLEMECRQELFVVQKAQTKLDRRLVHAVITASRDDDNSNDNNEENDGTGNAIIDVRAGTGGDEASLFAKELLECYVKTAKSFSWKAELLTESHTDIGGIREASLSVSGRPAYRPHMLHAGVGEDQNGQNLNLHEAVGEHDDDDDDDEWIPLLGPYGTFRFESGVHRVQRVPVNDVRIHTSACSVAVLPALDREQENRLQQLLPMSELKMETMRASGAGGQHVNTTDSAVRITHIPTGITASIQDERSQHKNKEKAMRLIAARVRDLQRTEAERSRGQIRSSLMGGGNRGERIRTYNYPQDRITDHRSKQSLFGIAQLLAGTNMDSSSTSGGSGSSGMVISFQPMLLSLHQQERLRKVEEEHTAS